MGVSLEALAMAGADCVDCSIDFDEDDDCLFPQHLLASDEDDDCLFPQHLFSQHLVASDKLVGVDESDHEDVDDSSSESRRVCSREEIKAMSYEFDDSSSESRRGCNEGEIEASDGDDDGSSENRRGCKGDQEIKASDEVDDSSSESRQGCKEEEIKARLVLWAKAVTSSIREKFETC